MVEWQIDIFHTIQNPMILLGDKQNISTYSLESYDYLKLSQVKYRLLQTESSEVFTDAPFHQPYIQHVHLLYLACRNIKNKDCVLPFEYSGKTYETCTWTGNKYWCPTVTDANNRYIKNKWDYCKHTRSCAKGMYLSHADISCWHVSQFSIRQLVTRSVGQFLSVQNIRVLI